MPTTDKNMQVLVADDSLNMIRTLANMLRLLGYENIIRVDDGDKAIAKLNSTRVDLVLCDWNMPHAKGIDVLRFVRDDDRLRHLPFIMITGEVDLQTVAEAGEVEVDAYLLKPFTRDDLKSRIDEVLLKKQTPAPIDVHLSVAKVYREARQYGLAMEELKKALKLNPRSPRVMYAVGEIQEAQGELEGATKYYARSVEFGNLFLKGHEALARIYEAKGDLEKATEHLKTAVKISPKNVPRQLTLSQTLLKSGQTMEAHKILKIVMQLADRNRAEVAFQVGEMYLAAGMAEEAQHVFGQALEDNPKAIHIYNRMGIALRRQKKFREAIDNYLIAIRMDQENEGLYYNLGRAYYDAGDKDRSVAAMKRAVALNPDFGEAREFLSRVGAA